MVFEAVASSGAGVTATWLKDNAQLDDKLADRLKVEKDLTQKGDKLYLDQNCIFTRPINPLTFVRHRCHFRLTQCRSLSNLVDAGDTEGQSVQPRALQLHNRRQRSVHVQGDRRWWRNLHLLGKP